MHVKDYFSHRSLHLEFTLINKPSLLKRTRILSPSPLYLTVLLISVHVVREMKTEMIIDIQLVAFQTKVAAVLFDISTHGNLWKFPLLTQPPLTPEYVATQDELKQKFGFYCCRWQLSVSSYFKNPLRKTAISSPGTYTPSRPCGME